MKLPRDISGNDLVKLLGLFGYSVTRQRGSHIRLTTKTNGEHNVTLVAHDPIKIGTLSDILNDVADHHGLTKQQLAEVLFGP